MKNILKEILNGDRIGLVDIGASGGVEPRWASVQGLLRCYLFEPDERSYAAITNTDEITVFPFALGNKIEDGAFNLCRKPQVSSKLLPNTEFVSRFPDPNRWDVIGNEACSFSTLDHIAAEHDLDIDFMKLDVQGGEDSVLAGAEDILNSPLIGLETEIEFLHLYKGQPLFGDLTNILAAKGYEFIDFVRLCRWERKQFSEHGQTVFGDALYMKSPETFALELAKVPEKLAQSKARRYIAICALYDRVDLLGICAQVFEAFLDEATLQRLNKLLVHMSARRKKVDFILRVANRFLRAMGFRVIPLQWK